MDITNAHLVYFSPTGTTRKILRSIISGIGVETIFELDLTLPRERQAFNLPINTNLLLLGVPVYEEHIPPVIRPALESLVGNGQYAIIVAVYGNVGFGLALQEMKELLRRKGFAVIAGAAFIGEHSFSSSDFSVAENRPDKTDLEIACDFGHAFAKKLSSPSPSTCNFPGRLPIMSRFLPEGSAAKFARLPDFNQALCSNCGLCINKCPVSAIDILTMAVDDAKCLRCFACVRKCPQKARSIKLKRAWLVKLVLRKSVTCRQEPQIFL